MKPSESYWNYTYFVELKDNIPQPECGSMVSQFLAGLFWWGLPYPPGETMSPAISRGWVCWQWESGISPSVTNWVSVSLKFWLTA